MRHSERARREELERIRLGVYAFRTVKDWRSASRLGRGRRPWWWSALYAAARRLNRFLLEHPGMRRQHR